MRSEILKTYRVLHTWTGLVSGMALFVAFYAGALTLFKDPITAWATPPVEGGETVISLDDASILISKTLEVRPEIAKGFDLRLAPGTTAVEGLEWMQSADEHDRLSGQGFLATSSPSGELVVRAAPRSKVGEQIDVLHRVVGLPIDGDLTRLVTGFFAILYFLAVVSGLVIVLPTLTRDFLALRLEATLRRMWRDVHNVVGIGSFPFHVVIALSSATFALHDGIYGLQNLTVHEGKLGAMFRGGAPKPPPGPRELGALRSPEEIVAAVREVAPELELTSLQYVALESPRAAVRVWGRDARGFESRAPGGFAMVDPYTGEVLTTQYVPGHQSFAGALLSSVFALHFGSFGGTPVKAMYFILALLGAWLFYSGNVLWVEARRKTAKKTKVAAPEQARAVRRMASLTVGVCVGSMIGISAMLVATKAGVEEVSGLRVVYYSIWFSSVGWSFFRGPGRASVELLSILSMATLAIPLSSALGTVRLGWAHADTVGVDVVAAAMGLGFAVMASKTARRVYGGPLDSVWSAR